MKLKNGMDISGTPTKAEYQRNENGLYTVDIKFYIAEKPNGQKYKAFLRLENAKLPVEDEKGVIDLDKIEIECFVDNKKENKEAIFEIIIPDD